MTSTDKTISNIIINKLTKTMYDSITPNEDEFYIVDPEFTGGELLESNSDGDIVESSTTLSDYSALFTTKFTSAEE